MIDRKQLYSETESHKQDWFIPQYSVRSAFPSDNMFYTHIYVNAFE